jgi:hypothetical protein
MMENNRTADHCAKKIMKQKKETLKNKKSIAFSRTAFQRITFFFIIMRPQIDELTRSLTTYKKAQNHFAIVIA